MMKFVLIIAAVVLISGTNGAPGKGDKKHHGGPMKCDGTELKFTEEMKKSNQACFAKYHVGGRNHTEKPDTKTADVKTKDNKKHHNHNHANMTCMMVCKLQAAGVIGQDGKADKTKIDSFVKSVFPASVQDSLVKSISTCADDKGASMEISADGKCDSYKPFVQCIHAATKQACKWGNHESEADEE